MIEIILQIKELCIIDIARKLKIDVKGKKALCFSGHDKNPSLTFDDKKGLYNCFGCEEQGDQITLVRHVCKLDFLEAIQWFKQEYQIGGIVSEKNKRIFKTAAKQKISEEETNKPNPEIYEFLVASLSLSNKGEVYLCNERCFSKELITKLEIKDIPNPQLIFTTLKNKFGIDALMKCGLCKLDDKGVYKFIWWDHVIIFPFADLNHRINYLQARRLNWKSGAKYVNLKGIKPYPYNLQILNELNSNDRIHICEGIPDTISAIQLGLHAIGILGANNFSKNYLNLLSNYQIYIIPDHDVGGETFYKKVREAFETIGKSIQIKKIPEQFKDINELLIKQNYRPQ